MRAIFRSLSKSAPHYQFWYISDFLVSGCVYHADCRRLYAELEVDVEMIGFNEDDPDTTFAGERNAAINVLHSRLLKSTRVVWTAEEVSVEFFGVLEVAVSPGNRFRLTDIPVKVNLFLISPFFIELNGAQLNSVQ